MRVSTGHRRLMQVIRSVRRRWRLRVALRGTATVLGAGLLVFLISAYGMDQAKFSPTAVLAFRIFAYVGLLVLALRYLLMPLLRRVSDERVALYLEEHEPSLQARVLSAVELAATEEDASESFSPAMIDRLVENAVEECARIDHGRRVEARSLRLSSSMLVTAMGAAAIVLLLSPSFLRHSSPYLFPFSGAEVDNPYRIEVVPGNTRVARGAELKIMAYLHNFDSDEVEIAVQRGPEGDWERFPMTLDEDTGERVIFLFDLDDQTEYFVEASGVRSSLFRIDVAELPYVAALTLEYHFPAYTGLETRVQENGGDIAALRGTEVRLSAVPTVPVASGAIVFEDGDSLPLAPSDDGSLTGSIEVTRDGFYRIVFTSLAGDHVVGSPDYLIDVLKDQPPYVSFSKPGRDIKVTNIEEVFVGVEAEDDYGIRTVELVYSVNGESEQAIELYSGRRKDVSAGHTFYLEEITLQPGDFISYYARASDDNRVSGQQTAVTDIYFMEVRPFERTYRQAEQQQQPGGGGGGGFDSSLSQRQRDVIAATFKMARDRDKVSDDEFRENLTTLALAQGKLREQVQRLLTRIQSRGIVQMDSTFRTIAEALPLAMEAMSEAEGFLGERKPEDALSPEQRALQQLQRAESVFRESQVGQQSGGGGGGGQTAEADELADLFELELDKQRNQYESVQRDQQQQVDEQIDETLQKLQELARRQQQENERQRARANQNQSGGGSGTQRELAEEAEELARQLERLAREESLPELSRTASELRQAAEEMRRAAANSRSSTGSEGISALDRLKEARRQLDRNRSAGLQRDVEEAARRAERLAQEQRDVMEDVERLSQSERAQGQRLDRLMERKEEMAAEVADLEADLDRLARDSRREQRDASRKLQEAASQIRDDKLEDKIRYSRGVVQQRSPEYAREFEDQIASDIDQLRDKIDEARSAIGETKEQRLARTLDDTHDLVRSLESLEERTRQGSDPEQSEQGGRQQAEGQQQGERQDQTAEGNRSGQPPEATDTRDGFPGFNDGDVRQFRREFGERREEAERLRDQLRQEGINTEELDSIVERLRQLERDRLYGDPRGLAELQAQVIQGLKEFEYVLRRELGGADARELLLTGSDEVPDGYRELVEEYYKSLAEEGGGGN